MAAFGDFGLLWSENTTLLHDKLKMAIKLGYETVAIDYHLEEFPGKGKQAKKAASIKPAREIVVGDGIIEKIQTDLQLVGRRVQQFSRITAVFTNADQGRDIQRNELIQGYDILAVRPTTDKLFHMCCNDMDVDIISIDMTQRVPYYFKRQSVSPAIKRGVHFELVYAPMIRDATARRNILSTAFSLISICKGKNIIISSGSEKAMELRGPYDVANLALLFNLTQAQAKDAISMNYREVLMHSRGRKTAKCILSIVKTAPKMDDDEETEADEEVKQPVKKKKKCG